MDDRPAGSGELPGRRARRVGVCGLVIVSVLALAPRAFAVGQLTYDGCQNDDGSSGCVDLPGDFPLNGASSVTVSPDGNSVYVAATNDSSVSHFFRASAGQLTYDGCLNDDGSSSCGDLPGDPLSGANSVAVKGKSAYVGSSLASSISRFSLQTLGQLTYQDCLNDDGTSSCTDLPGTPLDGAHSAAVSPDGNSVYVASTIAESVSWFKRGAGGVLTYKGCLNDDGSSSCTDLRGTPLVGARSVAVSPDGNSVYVVSSSGSSIASISRFDRGSGGALTYKGCFNGDGSSHCTDLPGSPLLGAESVAVSPDRESVYVASYYADSISRFNRGPNGALAYAGCLNDAGTSHCNSLPGSPLDGAASVAVSPDNKSAYVAGGAADSLARFKRGAGGTLTYKDCFNDDGSSNCTDLPGTPLNQAQSVVVSPDDNSVYVASNLANSVSHFFRSP